MKRYRTRISASRRTMPSSRIFCSSNHYAITVHNYYDGYVYLWVANQGNIKEIQSLLSELSDLEDNSYGDESAQYEYEELVEEMLNLVRYSTTISDRDIDHHTNEYYDSRTETTYHIVNKVPYVVYF